MDLNSTVSAQRLHIGFFGTVNSGKSSLVNALTGQELSIVSDTRGTTTDPVQKAMELLPLGPVVIIDTPGLDDGTELGKLRIERTMQMLRKTDIAVIVTDASEKDEETESFIEIVKEKGIPVIFVRNKCDLDDTDADGSDVLFVSAKTGKNIDELKRRIAASIPAVRAEKRIVSDLLKKGDTVILVTPIDESAPKRRLILPQQQTIRDVLDSDAVCLVTKETQLETLLSSLPKKPRLVVTDSQAFGFVNKVVPKDIPLTSFSMLFARYKGDLFALADGADTLDKLRDGDRVLISEGCTHHRQCNDIGTVKLPNWIRQKTGKEPEFVFTSGGEFPQDLSAYRLIVHCGACMLNEREMHSRNQRAAQQGIPMTNYGILIAYVTGILKRSVELFPDIAALL